MNPIRAAISRPVAVISAVLLVFLFGAVALDTIPIQLTPDVRNPTIEVETDWPGAAPAEVEREIIDKQEEALKGIEGLRKMTSAAQQGRARVNLEFGPGQNMDRIMMLVANKLDQVSGYPAEADEPVLETSGTDDQPIAWFMLKMAPGQERPVDSMGDFVEDVVKDRLERVPGVSRVNVYGGDERELQVIVDPERLAAYQLTVPNVLDALRAANLSVTAGDVNEGKRRYVVRVEGRLGGLDQVRDVVVRTGVDPQTGRQARVVVGDIAQVRFGFKEGTTVRRHNGTPMIGINTVRETGANVIETMEGIRAAVRELSEGPMKQVGMTIEQVYDETIYIESAIDLVIQNIYTGGVLAAIALLLFLRALGPTIIVSLAIPISVIGAFVGMAALGRSLNVISLAGIAFAVGMVVDAAIVVAERIFRERERGASRAAAAFKGTSHVWGANLASVMTTVMVFIPILTLELEVGQLFRDIAVAISVAVTLSLLVSITVVPALARRLLGRRRAPGGGVKLPGIDHFGRGFAAMMIGFAKLTSRHRSAALLALLIIIGGAAAVTVTFLPKLEYLPEGNRNLVLGRILPPPGYNLETTTEIAKKIEDSVRPLWASVSGPESEPGQPPKIDSFFFVALRNFAIIAASSADPERAADLIPVIRGPMFAEPGTFGFVSQPSLFGRSIGSGRSIDLDISGPELEQVLEVALRATQKVEQVMPRAQGNQLRPLPGLELGAPEVRVLPNLTLLADNGVSVRTFGSTIDTFNDGLRVDEITVDGRRMDLTLKGPVDHVARTQGIGELPVVTEAGTIVPTASLGEVIVTSGPTEIRRIERARTVTLDISPAPGIPLQQAMEILQDQVIAPIVAEGVPAGVTLELSGTADKLTEAWGAMVWQLALALVIVYLVIAVLFESFVYPLVIMISVPTATAGAVLGLAALNLTTFQPLDMLTMLGFVILIGIVVNNAILLVHEALHQMRREGLPPAEAIPEAVRTRIRPIFTTTLTSLLGMLPLVLFPGAGSELYRGLGAVVLGGLAMSALLTLLTVPPLMALVVSVVERGRIKRARMRRPPPPAPPLPLRRAAE